MEIIETGMLVRGVQDTARAIMTFGHVVALADGALIATCRAGTTKDSADETIEFYRSRDGDAPGPKAGAPLVKRTSIICSVRSNSAI